MQGQKNSINSFTEPVDFDPGAVSNNSGISQQNSWNEMINPVDNRLSNYMLSSGSATNYGGWTLGESSSQDRTIDDNVKTDHGWPGPGPINGLSGNNHIAGAPGPASLVFPGSSSNRIPPNVNLNKEPGPSSDNGGSSSSLGSWGSSCKRKAFEGASGGSSSCFSQPENNLWHTVPSRISASNGLNISSPQENSSVRRGVASDVFPASTVTDNAESAFRNFNSRRLSYGQIHDSLPTNVRHSNTNGLPTQSHPMHGHNISRNGNPFPWNLSSNSRVGNLTNFSGERENPMPVAAGELTNSSQDPTNWALNGNNSASRVGPSSNVHHFSTPPWLPHHLSMMHNQQRILEVSPWALFPSVDSELGAQSGNFLPIPPGPSSSSHPYSRSGFPVDRQVDDVFGISSSWRALAADVEGRQRIISEIRQVLNAMRRGDNLRAEDFMLFDPFVYHGMAEFHDRHRDMRLDVDNMSYEELLALGERIGDVSTGLSEETVLKLMKQRKYLSLTNESPSDLEPCCICQEEFVIGDDLGALDCGHDFHTNCIKQWLKLKNLCPICKTKALDT